MLEGMAKESSYEVSWTCLGDGWKVCGAAACVRDTKTPILYIGCSSARLYCKVAAALAARSCGPMRSEVAQHLHIHIRGIYIYCAAERTI